ncbi:MAG: acyl-CoA dehydrogenase family protein [Brevibacterium sp.]|nr:acyl-CoA dehydrogenase family protein [Brevibacterium sp.]
MAVSTEEQMMIDTVAEFIDHDVKPHVNRVEHADEYPEKWIQTMKDMGIYGLAIDEPWGMGKVSTEAYALITQELARGWMSLAGAMGGHTVVAKLIAEYGTAEQKDKYLPRLATGELRATMALTEPGGGSDLQAMRTNATKDGEDYVINGSKTWITNARKSDLIALLVKTDPSAEPRHKGISIILVEKGEGFTVSKNLSKLGYKGVETCELVFENLRQSQSQLLGETEGVGFKQMMKGLEIGRIQVASRSLGVAQAAINDAVKYSQERESMGKPIWRHQAVGNQLAKMATKLEAARQLVLHAARTYDSGERVDMEAGMAKYYASEMAAEVALDAIRVHGGYGYSTEYDVERYYRDAPLMIVGEGTNEIQLGVIAKQLIGRNKA